MRRSSPRSLYNFSVPLDVIRHALLRDPRGKASSPLLGVALDRIAGAQS